MQYIDLTAEEQAQAWAELREFTRTNADVLSITGLGARLGWGKSAAKALLNPTEKSPRAAATLERLAQAQQLLAGYGYRATRPAWLTPVIGARRQTTGEEQRLELDLRQLEAEYLRLAPDYIQARAIAQEFALSPDYAARAEEIGRYLEGLLADMLVARSALRLLPLEERPDL